MSKTFNELFDEFFNKKFIKPEEKVEDTLETFFNNLGIRKKDEIIEKSNINIEKKEVEEFLKKEIDKVIDIFKKIDNPSNISEEQEKIFDKTLGAPDKVEHFKDGNLLFEKKIWHTERGDLVKIIVVDESEVVDEPEIVKDLEEELKQAIEFEDYEKAAAIRDLIKKDKKNKKKL